MALEEFISMFKKNQVAVLVHTFNDEHTLGTVHSSVLEDSQDVIVENDG